MNILDIYTTRKPIKNDELQRKLYIKKTSKYK
jgi:hypothetical protein